MAIVKVNWSGGKDSTASARNIKSARNKFIRDYGYYTIIMIKEVNL